MADQGRQEEGREVQREQRQPVAGQDGRQPQADRRSDRLQNQHDPGGDQRPALEGEDEGQQIERERRDPQEGNRGHVGGDVSGDAEQQARRGGGQQDPGRPLPPADTALRRDANSGPLPHRPPRPQRQAQDQEHEHQVPGAPGHGLNAKADQGLDQEGIGHQRQEASQVARDIEAIGAAPRRARTGEPGLEQRRGGRQGGEGRAQRHGECAQQPDHRLVRRALAEPDSDAEGEDQGAGRQDTQVDLHLAAHGGEPLQQVCIAVANQERDLKEDETGVPDRRRAAQARQQELRGHRLYEKHQGGAEEHRRREQHRGGDGRRTRAGGVGHRAPPAQNHLRLPCPGACARTHAD